MLFAQAVTAPQRGPDEAASAQKPPAADASPPAIDQNPYLQGYIGKITADNVNIRSGPAAIYHPVGQFEPGQEIIVREERMGQSNWARIEPTPQCFSYISTRYVRLDPIGLQQLSVPEEAPVQPGLTVGADEGTVTAAGTDSVEKDSVIFDDETAADADNTSETTPKHDFLWKKTVQGYVTGNNVRVRAGSIKALPENAVIQMKLNKGDTVQVIGKRDDYYMIIPPEGASFWVALDYVTNVKPLTADAMLALRGQAGQAVVESGGPTAMAEIKDEFQEYKEIAALFKSEQARPLKQRDFKDIRARLTKLIQNAASPSIKNAAMTLSYNVTQAEIAVKLFKESLAQDAQLEKQLESIDQRVKEVVSAAGTNPDQPGQFVTYGRLAPSAVFTAPLKQKRYLVIGDNEEILYYAVAAEEGIDLEPYIGKVVSMIGNIKYDPFGKVRILKVSSIVDLPSRNIKTTSDQDN